MKRTSALILAALLIMGSLSGCKSEEEIEAFRKQREAHKAGAAQEAVQPETEEPETLTVLGETDLPEDLMGAELTQPETKDPLFEMPDDLILFHNVAGDAFSVEMQPEWTKHPYDWDKLDGFLDSKRYKDDTYHTRFGVDVSHYQKSVDWETLKDQGVEFAIIRIGFRGYGEEGTLKRDLMYAKHMDGALDADLDVGIYFFSQALNEDEAAEEARLVLDILDGRQLDLPVFFDQEFIINDKGRADDLEKPQLMANAKTFCQVIRDGGYDVGVYMNMEWEAYCYDLKEFEEQGYTIWYADYEYAPQTPYDFTFWQFTCEGTMEGCDTLMDLNLQFVKD